MPELPDVEHFRRTFAEHAPGRRVRRVVVTDPGILRNAPPEALDRALVGRRSGEPQRRGKWLVAPADGPALLIHFGMTGDLVWDEDASGRHRHDRMILVFDRGELRYRNLRKLGGVWLATTPEDVDDFLGHLGPDALDLGRPEFLERLAPKRGRVKAALLDQTFVAGIGNLLADEILWRARIHPSRPIDGLTDQERRTLFRELRSVVRSTVERYPGGFHRGWMGARGRPAAGCPRCGTELARTVVGGRTTYLCPRCQDPSGRG
ncbi:MAG TPA: DNA-formamidopyrimidine glycosylase family protein [Actinomycetota bacterium]|nr:DNA-formamidopyrimidine glycosylase family protein [Actinomycetota bacterium]